jgi:SHS2 domain-containing protein
MYEIFGHTADVGIRVRASSLEALLADAAQGLLALLVENAQDVEPRTRESFLIPGCDPPLLLFDWLNELLWAFESRRMLFCRFETGMEPAGVRAAAWGEPFDPARHRLDHEVKAITYHALRAGPLPDGSWEGSCVLDI